MRAMDESKYNTFFKTGDRISDLIVKQYIKQIKNLEYIKASCMHCTQHDQVELAAKNPSQSQELLLP